MKKFLTRLIAIVFMITLGYQQYSFADLISPSPVDTIIPGTFLIGFIGVIILFVSAISFFALKSSIKKNGESESDNVTKLNKVQRRIYIWGIIISIIVHMYVGLVFEYSIFLSLIPIIGFIISIIIRLNKNKKLSNIICWITIAVICVFPIICGIKNKIVENYNNEVLKYIDGTGSMANPFHIDGTNIKKLIEAIIEHNSKGKNITIVYNNENYQSKVELKQLLNIISDKYYIEIDYTNGYIDKLILKTTPLDYFQIAAHNSRFEAYEGKSVKGSKVKNLIQTVRSNNAANIDKEDLIVKIIYDSQLIELNNLLPIIKTGYTYSVTLNYDKDGLVNEILVEQKTNSYEE